MESSSKTTREISLQEKQTPKLKFGIDRLLSDKPPSLRNSEVCAVDKFLPVTKPTAIVPCSDCVSSLFRCCSLTPEGSGHQDHHLGYLGQAHPVYTNSNGHYTVQPIRPFATRPGKFK